MDIARDSIRTFLSRVFSLCAGGALSVLIARWLGPEGQGLYSLAATAATVAAVVVNCGFGLSNVYFLGKKRFTPDEIASSSVGFALLAGAVGFAVAAVVGVWLDVPGLSGVPRSALILALTGIPFYNLSEYFFYYLIGSDRITHFNVASASRNAIQLLFVLVFAASGWLGLGTAVFSWVIGFAGAAGLGILYSRRFASVGVSLRPDLVRAAVSFGTKGYLSRIASFLYYRVDMFILSYFLGPAAVGQYAVAVLLAELLWNIPSSIAPSVMYKSASDESSDRDRLTASACRHTILACTVCAGLIALLARPLIGAAFGRAYLGSVTPLLVLLPGTAFLSLGGILANDFVGRGKQLTNSVAALITLAINVPLNFILIPVWGIPGAAAASTFSYCVGVVVMVVRFLRITKMKPGQILLPRAGDMKPYLRLAKSVLSRR
ncbi:MAG: flippase [Candidatus Eisenbacteria bacterium]